MQTSRRILTPEQCEKLLANLDECLAFFAEKQGMLNGPEIRTKSMLSVLRNEIARQIQDDTSAPFG